jgi:uncharacterized membrane protein YagU involved in acid resistance
MKPVDIIVLCLAVFIGIAICIPLIGEVWWDQPYDDHRAKLIGGLIASSIAIISIYVGAKLNDK